jgi:prepilin-type N-terminal cleavage/methylation domain-containing protein
MTRTTAGQLVLHPLRAARAGARRAFTLIELLVAVGAVALIAVGLAAVFGSVGDTVTGGRSVSGFTAYAALLERQLRDDISRMSRDGFLLIVNQEAEGGEPVALYPGQPQAPGSRPPAPHQQRPRRIDEMLFFRKGDFVSGREPLGPGYTARGNSAMIYYGHGTSQPVDEGITSVYVRPRVDDTNDNAGRLGEPGLLAGGLPNPNRYASEWGLLRLPVVLAGDTMTATDRPALLTLPDASPYLQDSEIQVGAQPAAKSVFGAVARLGAPAARTVRGAAIGAQEKGNLLLASGLVDVVTDDLDEIRRTIISSPADTGPGPSYQFKTPSDIQEADLTLSEYYGVAAPFAVQQAWMLDALPAPSTGFIAGLGRPWSPPSAYPPDWVGLPVQQSDIRVRYERSPPAYLEPMKLTTRPLERAVRLADQMVLTSPLLVPRCSEFIVEWSFGKVTEDGRLIWHGIERWVDIDDDDLQDPEEVVAQPYLDNDEQRFALPYRLLEPAPVGVNPAFASEGDLFGSYPVSPQLIHGFESPSDRWTFSAGGRNVLASFFGYMDPTFNPANPGRPVGLPQFPAPFTGALPSAADYLPWAWPELIRITVSLADPADPAIEQTFQFVFEAPGNPAP